MKKTIALLLPLLAATLAGAAEVGEQISIPRNSIQCNDVRVPSPDGRRCHYCYNFDDDISARITVTTAIDNVPKFSGSFNSCLALNQLMGGGADVNAIIIEKTEKLFGTVKSTTLQIQLAPPFGPGLIGISQ